MSNIAVPCIAGHIHAYERINPVFNYTLNACAPAYITIGDAGNAEGTYAYFVDQAGQCPAVPVNATASYQPDQFGTGIGLVGTPLACPSLLGKPLAAVQFIVQVPDRYSYVKYEALC